MEGQNQTPKQNNFFGYYLMLDIYDCDPEAMEDIKRCYQYLDRLTDLLGVEKLSPPFIIYTDGEKYPDKAGLSGWVPFVDFRSETFAGASIHTLTPTNFISIDIFGCQEFNKDRIKEFVQRIFNPKRIEEKYILRGEKYTNGSPP